MFEVECPSCKASYQVDERRVPPTGLKMRCPKCGTSFQVDAPGAAALPGTAASPPAASPAAAPVLGAALGLGARAASGQHKATMIGLPPAPGGPAAAPPRPGAAGAPPAPPARAPLGGPAPAGGPPRPAPPRALKQTMIGVAPAQSSSSASSTSPASVPTRSSTSTGFELESIEEVDLDSEPDPDEALIPATPGGVRGAGLSGSHELDLPSPSSRKKQAGEIELPSMAPDADDSFGVSDFGDDLPDLPGAIGLPTKVGDARAGGFGDVDLPSPRPSADLADLPDLTSDLPDLDAGLPIVGAGLPSLGGAGLPSLGGAALPSLGGPGLPSVGSAGPASVNLPSVAYQLPSSDTGLPAQAGAAPASPRPLGGGRPSDDLFGDGPTLPPESARGASASSSSAFDALGAGSADDDEFDAFPTETAPKKTTATAGGGAGYGEVALDAGAGGLALGDEIERAPAPAAAAVAPVVLPGGPAGAAASAPVELPRGGVGPQIPLKPSGVTRGTKIAAAVGLSLAIGGGALAALPDVGPYGAHFVLDFVGADGHRAALEADMNAAAKGLGADTVVDVENAFRAIERGREAAPRFRPRFAYAAYVGFVRQIRFGDDSNVVAQAKVLLDGLAEHRVDEVPHLDLARLAASAALGRFDEVIAQGRGLLARGPDHAAIVGEAALARGDVALSADAFAAVLRKDSARGHFGLARTYRLARKDTEAKAEIEKTLALSPRHTGAILLRAEFESADVSRDEALVKQLTELAAPNPSVSTGERVRALVVLGELHLARSRVKQAEAAFQAALGLEAGNARAQRGLADTLFESGRYGEALARYEAASKASPKDLAASLGIVRAKLRLEGLEDASKLLAELEVAHPKSTPVAYWSGRAKEAAGEREAAQKAFERAIEFGENAPELVASYVALTRLLGQLGQLEAAAVTIAAAEKRFPENPEVFRALGELAASRGSYEEAIAHFDSALGLDPTNIGFRFSRGVALRQARRFEEAAVEFDAVEKVEKDFPGLSLERGNLFEASGRTEEALKAYEAALAQAPDDPDLMLRVGCAKATAGQPGPAIELLKKVFEARPNSAEANFCQGVALLKKGDDLPEARRFLERAIGLDATRAAYHLYVGWVAIELHDYTLAARSLDRALELDQTLADAYWQRGVLRVRQGAVKDAELDLRRALQLSPTRFEAHAALAEAYMQTGKEQDALVEWKAALADGHGEAFWHYRYGKLLLDNRQTAEARPELEKAVEKGSQGTAAPWLWEAHRLLALCIGRTREAVPHWEAFVEHAEKNSPYMAEALRELKAIVH